MRTHRRVVVGCSQLQSAGGGRKQRALAGMVAGGGRGCCCCAAVVELLQRQHSGGLWRRPGRITSEPCGYNTSAVLPWKPCSSSSAEAVAIGAGVLQNTDAAC